jgi:hypothetical protein
MVCGLKETAAARRAGYGNRGYADAVVGHRRARSEKVQAAIREEPPACRSPVVLTMRPWCDLPVEELMAQR